MRKLLLLSFVAACTEEAPPPPPPAPAKAPASAPASQPASAPAAPMLKKVDAGPRVIQVEGDCTVDGIKAYAGQPIEKTSVIETHEGKLIFTPMVGGIVQLRPNAKLELGKSEKKEWSLKLLAGAVWSFLPKGQASFEVVSGSAVAGVRGTVFYVQQTAADDNYICDCDGEVEVSNGGKKPQVLKSKVQHKGVVLKGAKSKPEKKAINHTKEEAGELMKLQETITK